MPNADTHTSRLLQEDDTSLAYEFARKFPGYTAENLSEKGVRIRSLTTDYVDSNTHSLPRFVSDS